MSDKPEKIYAYPGSLIYSLKPAKLTVEYIRADLAKPSDISCGDGCLAVKGGDLCCGECAKVKIKNLFKYLDSFENENDVETIVRIKNALSTRETP